MKNLKNLSVWIIAITLILGLAGCGKKDNNVYVSKRGTYSLQYPAKWRFLDDERKLTKIREEINAQIPAQAKYEFNPDVLFVGGKTQGGMVIVSPLSLTEPEKNELQNNEQKLLKLLRETQKEMGFLSDKPAIEKINDKQFQTMIGTTADQGMSVSAICLHESHLYMFMFSCSESEFEEWKPTFMQCIRSVSFKEEDISKAREAFEKTKAGFFTGLWHGFLILPRFIVSFFWKFDLYAKNNTGTGYMIGFILGVIWFVGATGGSSRRR